MKTVVITGGTDGMGAALARHFLRSGDRVTVVGRSRSKFDALVAAATAEDASVVGRAEFIQADLSSVAGSRQSVRRLLAANERIDVLILAASFVRTRRDVTSEGHESSWALFFLSKYLFVTELAPLLDKSEQPVVVNTSVPGTRADAIAFDDLELTERFTYQRSNAQQRRANELLGILATRDNADLAYVTWGPSRLVRTSFAGDLGIALKVATAVLGALGQSPAAAIRSIIHITEAPVAGRTAYRGPKQVPLTITDQDEQDTTRLATAVEASL